MSLLNIFHKKGSKNICSENTAHASMSLFLLMHPQKGIWYWVCVQGCSRTAVLDSAGRMWPSCSEGDVSRHFPSRPCILNTPAWHGAQCGRVSIKSHLCDTFNMEWTMIFSHLFYERSYFIWIDHFLSSAITGSLAQSVKAVIFCFPVLSQIFTVSQPARNNQHS